MKSSQRSYSWVAVMAFAGALVPACLTEAPSSSVESTESGETEALKAAPQCLICPVVPQMQARGEYISPECQACPGTCGNGVCDTGETHASCPSDCVATGPVCGNGICESGESHASCPSDCAATGPTCGNGICESGETSTSCPSDCSGTNCPIPAGGITNRPICPM